MFNLKMVDTAGGGIRKLFMYQRQRFFPMPDYDLSGNRVQLTLTGKVLDMDYARLLARDGGLELQDIMALDKVQKRQPLNADDERRLKSRGLIEGRKPNYFIARSLAQQTGQKAKYSKNAAFDKQYYLDLICKAVKEHGTMTRKDVDELLWNKLPEWMDEKQRKAKVGNLLSELRRHGKIVNQGSDGQPSWALLNSPVG
jgi:ATP-dependent DNA helicase RecG